MSRRLRSELFRSEYVYERMKQEMALPRIVLACAWQVLLRLRSYLRFLCRKTARGVPWIFISSIGAGRSV